MIKYLVMDVDGTLTDGSIYMGDCSEICKSFNIKDGCGIKDILPSMSIVPVVITARKSRILKNRCKELGITMLYQGVSDKLAKLKAVVGKDLSIVAYAGDDLPDIPCMEAVKRAGGIVMAPADAIPEIRVLADYVSGQKAGEGAVRDCINFLAQDNRLDIEHRVQLAIDWILSGKYLEKVQPQDGKYNVQEYMTRNENECVLESHNKHIDIMYMLEGHEELKIYSPSCLSKAGEYDYVRDIERWNSGIVISHCVLVPGSIEVIYANQPHKGAIMHKREEKVKKLVYKLEV